MCAIAEKQSQSYRIEENIGIFTYANVVFYPLNFIAVSLVMYNLESMKFR